jgi:hypothetical protein
MENKPAPEPTPEPLIINTPEPTPVITELPAELPEQEKTEAVAPDTETESSHNPISKSKKKNIYSSIPKMNFVEQFDQHRLNYILQNREKFQCRVYEDDYDPFLAPSKMLAKSTNGQLKVSYFQTGKRNVGRLFAKGGVSLQSICREIRHTIAGHLYYDLDMVNAHPVILRFLCEKHDIPCDRLSEYIEDRESILADVLDLNPELDRDFVKDVFLSLINGGYTDYASVKKPTKFLKRFKTESKDILDDMCEKYESEYKRRKETKEYNPEGSTVNVILCDWENKILMAILAFFQNQGDITNDCVLCFDGIMVPRASLDYDEITALIPIIEEEVSNETGISVSLKIKPMDEGFELPSIGEYKEYKPFDPRDDFCWLDFDEKYRGHIFNSEQDIIHMTRVDVNRVLARVEQGNGFLVKKTDTKDNIIDIIDRNKPFTDLYF